MNPRTVGHIIPQVNAPPVVGEAEVRSHHLLDSLPAFHRILFSWLGHSLYQPIWKQKRYHATCKQCGVGLRPTGQEQFAIFAMPALGVGLAIAASATFDLSANPYDLWVVLTGMVVGMLAHYPIAKYEPVDPEALPDLPAARTTDRND